MFLESLEKAVIFQLTNRYTNIETVIVFQNKKCTVQLILILILQNNPRPIENCNF